MHVAALFAPGWPRALAGAEDPRVAKVLAGTIGIDMRNHVTPGGERPQDGRKAQEKSQPGVDLADEIKRSGLTAVCAAFRLSFNASDPYGTFAQELTTIDGLVGKGGLTAFGASVVKECNRLGIVVDLAHASNETVRGALKVSTHIARAAGAKPLARRARLFSQPVSS